MNKKNLIQKLKTGIAGLSLMSFLYFNSATAQENYIPKYNTIAHKMLMIEDSLKYDLPGYKVYPSLKTLDELVEGSKSYIPKKDPKTYTKDEVAKLSEEIYNGMLEKLSNIKERENIDLCYRASLIYLAIGEANGIPFYPVYLPLRLNRIAHMFVRYDPDGKHDPLNSNNLVNKGDINIETTGGKISGGKNEADENSDNYHIKKRRLSSKDVIENNFLKNLNEKELLSNTYMLKANLFCEEKEKKGNMNGYDYTKAIRYYNKSLSLNEKNIMGYICKAVKQKSEEDYGNALKNFNLALKLYEEPKIYISRGICYAKSDNLEKSIGDFTRAIDLTEGWKSESNSQEEKNELNYVLSIAINNRAISYRELGRTGDLEKDKKYLIKLKKLLREDY